MKFTTTWMDLENILLSEMNQMEKDKNQMTPLTGVLYKEKATNE